MRTALVSGATGFAGRFIVERFLTSGFGVVVLGREKPPADFFSASVDWVEGSLEPADASEAMLQGVDIFVHAAFSHVPGKYRGGEGDDPEGFRRLNTDGTEALFRCAKAAGVKRVVFLSSRAVYGRQQPGARLTEDMVPFPDTLYGIVKYKTEQLLDALADDRFLPVSLRATGIYGAARRDAPHKWQNLFSAFANGETCAPRVATEVHGDDLAAAVLIAATADGDALKRFGRAPVLNVSDIVLDRRDLLAAYREASGVEGPLPPTADASALNVMDCTRLTSLGWRPRGFLDLTHIA